MRSSKLTLYYYTLLDCLCYTDDTGRLWIPYTSDAPAVIEAGLQEQWFDAGMTADTVSRYLEYVGEI